MINGFVDEIYGANSGCYEFYKGEILKLVLD